MNKLNFFLNYLTDPRIATFAATPQRIVKNVCKRINFEEDIIVVEYGPGDGAYTKYILKQMSPNSKLIAIETNTKLEAYLRGINDDRLIVVNDDARNVLRILNNNGCECADYVISGIPFSFMTQQTGDGIVYDTFNILREGGKFLVYQFSTNVKKYLEKYFEHVLIKIEFGLPLYYIFEAKKDYLE
ncbi:MAG: hypothetical protein HQK79_11715 [Desulfobacterales bacterium]|nr:hypothetical protein [Desulfobacterales bacterium]MBF0397405.1 hypothetical protein [Desulfobacterales bacterium]